MEEKTADEVAAIFKAAGDSVTTIGVAKTEDETTDEYKARVKRNVEHLEIIKGYKKLDGTTSNSPTESFTEIDQTEATREKTERKGLQGSSGEGQSR